MAWKWGRLVESSGVPPIGSIEPVGDMGLVVGRRDSGDGRVRQRQPLRCQDERGHRHELERAAVAARRATVVMAAVPMCVAVRVPMGVVRGIAVPMRVLRVIGGIVAGETRIVMFTAWTMRDPCPGCLQGQHGQQQQHDDSFHGRGL